MGLFGGPSGTSKPPGATDNGSEPPGGPSDGPPGAAAKNDDHPITQKEIFNIPRTATTCPDGSAPVTFICGNDTMRLCKGDTIPAGGEPVDQKQLDRAGGKRASIKLMEHRS
jgi:hypothetical protein